MIIAIEGCDGIGKSTQVELLAKKMNAKVVKYPVYDSMTGHVIRSILSDNLLKDLNDAQRAVLIQSIMTINRYENEVGPNFDNTVILDRYILSSIAYGMSDGLPRRFILDINKYLIVPDKTIVLYGTPFRQNNEYYENKEKQEQVNKLFIEHAKLYDGYLVYANQPIDVVHDIIMAFLED